MNNRPVPSLCRTWNNCIYQEALLRIILVIRRLLLRFIGAASYIYSY